MQVAYPNRINRMVLVAVDDTVAPITSGVINFYLKDRDGPNQGLWFQGSDSTWQPTVAIAAVGVYDGDNGMWHADIPAPAWLDGVCYSMYLKDNSNRQLPYDDQVVCTLAISASLGNGAQTVTITVNDGTNPLENARVRMTNGLDTYVGSTDVSGVVAFSVNDATWAVAIAKSGYTFTPTALVVSGGISHTYSMTAISLAISDPGQITGYAYCYDENGALETGVSVTLTLTAGPESGVVYDSLPRTEISDGNALVTFTNLFPGATYQSSRGTTRKPVTFTIPANQALPYQLPPVVGTDS